MKDLIKTLVNHTFVRYAFSGATALATEEVVLYLAHGLAHFPLWLATGLAYLAAFGVNFSINRILTFAEHGAREGAVHKQTVRFALLVAVNLGVTQILMYTLTGIGVNYLIAKPLSTVVITLYNFWLYKHWVFKPETPRGGLGGEGGAGSGIGAESAVGTESSAGKGPAAGTVSEAGTESSDTSATGVSA